MADIINLRRARKARSRAEAEKRAEENRVRFGRTKHEISVRKAEKALDERRMNSGKLTKDITKTE
jgi:hypothetical protein